MNIKQAKLIPIEIIVAHLGGTQSQVKGHEIWFFSPFRPEERTPSFKANLKLNTWYDFALGQGGSVLDLWIDYHNQARTDKEAIKSALQGLETFFKGSPALTSNQTHTASKIRQIAVEEQPRFRLAKKLSSKIWFYPLKEEIERRGLSIGLVMRYVKQAQIIDDKTGKEYTGFAFPNNIGGYEISIPNPALGKSFKTNIGSKGFTSFIREENTKALIFEGFWDLLTFLQSGGETQGFNLYALNSLSFAGQVIAELKAAKDNVKSIFLFMDNDTSGTKAMYRFADELEPEGFTIGTLNHLYEGYKDLNDWWIKERGRILQAPALSNHFKDGVKTVVKTGLK